MGEEDFNEMSNLSIIQNIFKIIFNHLYKPIVLFVGHRQTVQTQIRRRKSRRLIRVFAAC